MPTPILATKLYIPPPRPQAVLRPGLVARLKEGGKLALISAPAGFGKTSLLSEWLAGHAPLARAAWLSLDEGDSDPARFLAYLISALQTIAANIGVGVMAALQSPQPPPTELLLTTLLNEAAALPEPFTLILDDYHVIDSRPVDRILAFLLDHLPPQMHLVIATREDPDLPLARLRARGQLTELRAADLRFTPAEAADFLNRVMGLDLSAEDIAALETRTEGWIAGLQLASLALQGHLSMRGHKDTAGFIKAFTGSHHFVLDYLLEEVLQQQTAGIQAFLLRTSILERLCGPLCDAVCFGLETGGQATLEYLERANLFIVPLDNERRWYRYHHLFAELLRQRLAHAALDTENGVAGLHIRASQWYEENGLELEAFQHAVAAQDIERAARLVEGESMQGKPGMPLHFRGAAAPVLRWLASLPRAELDARPALWARYAALSLVEGQSTGVMERLQAAEAALSAAMQTAEPDPRTRNLLGQIAAAWATLALSHYQLNAMISQAQRALEYLHPNNLPFRTTANWVLGTAYLWQGDRAAAYQAFTKAEALSQAAGDIFALTLAVSGLGMVQELDTRLYEAAETYQRCLELFGDPPLPHASESQLGLARIYYEWNDLDAAEQHAAQSLVYAKQYEQGIDRFVISEVFLARLKLVRGDGAGAAVNLARLEQTARQNNFIYRLPEIAAAQVLVCLRQGDLAAAEKTAQASGLPLCQARVFLSQGNPSAALEVLAAFRQQAQDRHWPDEQIRCLVLQALALQARGDADQALQVLGDALALAEPGGLIRSFVDEGLPMARLLAKITSRPELRGYINRLLAAFAAEAHPQAKPEDRPASSLLIEPLSPRELEILQLIALGLSNQSIGERLFLALDTVKGHNRRIFDKLQVQSRTEAVARARELGLL